MDVKARNLLLKYKDLSDDIFSAETQENFLGESLTKWSNHKEQLKSVKRVSDVRMLESFPELRTRLLLKISHKLEEFDATLSEWLSQLQKNVRYLNQDYYKIKCEVSSMAQEELQVLDVKCTSRCSFLEVLLYLDEVYGIINRYPEELSEALSKMREFDDENIEVKCPIVSSSVMRLTHIWLMSGFDL